MGLFSRKPKVDTATAVKRYLDEQLFHPQLIAEMDPIAVYLDTTRDGIVKADPGVAAVSRERFIDEITVVRVEIFKTAWSHHFKTKTPYVIAESHATTSYLAGEGRLDMLERGFPYNQAVAGSSVMLNVTSSERLAAGSSAFMNTFRLGLFKEWLAKGLSPDEAARAANRVGTDVNFDRQGPARLVATFFNSLGVAVNDEAAFATAAVFFGFYRGAREYLRELDVSAALLS